MEEIYSASTLKLDKFALCRILGGEGAGTIQAMTYQHLVGDGRIFMAASA